MDDIKHGLYLSIAELKRLRASIKTVLQQIEIFDPEDDGRSRLSYSRLEYKVSELIKLVED